MLFDNIEDFLEECNIVTWNKSMDATLTDRPERNEKNITETAGFPETAQECYVHVKKLQKDDKSINGMTWLKDGSRTCFAKYNVKYITPMCKKECDTCIFNSKSLS